MRLKWSVKGKLSDPCSSTPLRREAITLEATLLCVHMHKAEHVHHTHVLTDRSLILNGLRFYKKGQALNKSSFDITVDCVLALFLVSTIRNKPTLQLFRQTAI